MSIGSPDLIALWERGMGVQGMGKLEPLTPYNYTNGRYLVFKGNGSDGAPLGRIHQDGNVRNLLGEPLYYINMDEHAFCSMDFTFQGNIQKIRGTFYVLSDRTLFTFSEMNVKPLENETEEQALQRVFKKTAINLARQIVQAKNEMAQERIEMTLSDSNPFRRFRAFFTSRARRERASPDWRHSELENDHVFKSRSAAVSSLSLAPMILWATDARTRKTRPYNNYATVRLQVNSYYGLSLSFRFPPIKVGCTASLAEALRRSSRWENTPSVYTPRFQPR